MKFEKKQNIKSFIKDYKVAAFASSSHFLINEVLKEVDGGMKIIVEQGAGDGVLTKRLLGIVATNSKVIAIEQNKIFLEILRSIHDNRLTIWEGFAQDFEYTKFLTSDEKVDIIFSSIPFSFLKKEDREQIVRNAHENLLPGGKLIIFHQYSLLMKGELKKYFSNIKYKFIFRNFLPCFILIAQK